MISNITCVTVCVCVTYIYTVIAGYRWTDIAACVQWMAAFSSVLEDAGPTDVKFCSKVTPAEAHTLQTHVVSIRTVVSVTYLLAYLMISPGVTTTVMMLMMMMTT